MEKIRIQKYFTDCGVLSRRAAEAEIAAGRVLLNGSIAKIGDKMDPQCDVVKYKGKVLEMPKAFHTYIIINKPRGYLVSMSDDRERKCVTELLTDVKTRVYPVGRLDLNSEGLLLLTDDGELANVMTHPKHSVPKVYSVIVTGHVSDAQMKTLMSPMEIDGYMLKPVEVELIEERADSTKLRFTLHEGRNRQIRKMCDAAELKVRRLCRIAIGEIRLGGLKPGEYRTLDKSQIKYLMKIKNQAKAGNENA